MYVHAGGGQYLYNQIYFSNFFRRKYMGGIEGGFSGMNRILPGEPSIFNRESKKVDIQEKKTFSHFW